jgi:hypothetical protein
MVYPFWNISNWISLLLIYWGTGKHWSTFLPLQPRISEPWKKSSGDVWGIQEEEKHEINISNRKRECIFFNGSFFVIKRCKRIRNCCSI